VAFYPGACSERRQTKPFTEVERQGWTTAVPLLTLMGEADTWTLFPPCDAFLMDAKSARQSGRAQILSGAVHAFDAPDLPRRELPQYRSGDSPIPLIGTDRDARSDAFVPRAGIFEGAAGRVRRRRRPAKSKGGLRARRFRKIMSSWEPGRSFGPTRA